MGLIRATSALLHHKQWLKIELARGLQSRRFGMNRKAFGAAIAVPLSVLLLSGCVSQQQYDAVVAENNQLKAQLAQSQAEQKFVEAGDQLFPSGGFQMGPAG